MIDTQRAAYREEAAELLVELESSLLALEQRPDDGELIGRVFRAMHTIKGSGAMFGFDDIASFTHEVETLFDAVREGHIRVTPELVGVGLEARDHIQSLLREEADIAAGDRILKRLRHIGPSTSASVTYRIRFQPAADILLTGTDPLLLLRELAEMGELRLTAHADRIPGLEAFDPEQCYAEWEAVLTTDAGEDAIRGVFIFVEDRANIRIDRVDGDGHQVEQQTESRVEDVRKKTDTTATLRVPAAKVDTLVNIVGELVTVQARLSSYASASSDSEIQFIAEEVERLSELLRQSTMSIRTLPIGATFNRFQRLVRDLSSELGKKVELATAGDETELDKTVIEQLGEPLVHLVRNSIDHGIEMPETRIAAGKPPVGTIRMTATHSGSFVVIRVSDDGAGLDRRAIRARAVERGLIAADANLTDAQLDALILEPGFSTASAITEISGRGVGMDAVVRSLDALKGTLSVASTPGRGTEITLKIPLTLAIIDGLLVEAGGSYFVAPLSNILECVELQGRKLRTSGDRALVTVRGELVPYITLRERFHLAGEPPPIEQVMIADTREGKVGFVVDHVIGDHHAVIKKLGSLYRSVDEVSGATILGDGTVALVLDFDNVAAGAIRDCAA